MHLEMTRTSIINFSLLFFFTPSHLPITWREKRERDRERETEREREKALTQMKNTSLITRTR